MLKLFDRLYFKKTLKKAFFLASCLIPKSNNAVLRGYPAYEDNILAIYEGLKSRPVDTIIWVVDDTSVPPPVAVSSNTRIVKRLGLLDIYFSITSRFLFLTHGHFFDAPLRNQITVNLWHGIPFKAIGRNLGEAGRSDTVTIATSSFTRKIFAEAFDVPEVAVAITGQARTDRMFTRDRDQVWRQCFPDDPPPRRIFLWLPTYRATDVIDRGTDGKEFPNVYNCSDFCEQTFNEMLRETDSVCLVKPHPMAKGMARPILSHIYHIDETWLLERGVSLYELVGATDCLISDISSIIADYLLLDRPILLLFEDIVEYESSRGFSFNPVTDYLPAKVAANFSEFRKALAAVLNDEDDCSEKRARLRDLFFAFQDANSSDRILQLIFMEK